jgi:hypothetical protein
MKKLEEKTTQPWQMVYDQHKPPRRVRSLWRRGENLYARMAANNGKAYYYPLHADTVPDALTARHELKSLQNQNKLFPPSEMKLGDGAPKPVTKTGDLGINLAGAVKSSRKIKSISPRSERKLAARNFIPCFCKYFLAAKSFVTGKGG